MLTKAPATWLRCIYTLMAAHGTTSQWGAGEVTAHCYTTNALVGPAHLNQDVYTHAGSGDVFRVRSQDEKTP